MMLRNAIMGAAAILAAASGLTSAAAQQAQTEEQVLVAGTVDCRYQLRPLETAICSVPVLAAMDIQMITLFNALGLLVKPEVGVELAAQQQIFLKTREACGADIECIGATTATRIAELDTVLKDIASRGPY